MRDKKAIRDALEARIAQLDRGLLILNKQNGPFLSRAIYEAVREELDTFHKWVLSEEENS